MTPYQRLSRRLDRQECYASLCLACLRRAASTTARNEPNPPVDVEPKPLLVEEEPLLDPDSIEVKLAEGESEVRHELIHNGSSPPSPDFFLVSLSKTLLHFALGPVFSLIVVALNHQI